MSSLFEAESLALLEVLDRANEGPIPADLVLRMGLLDRRLAGAGAGVKATDAHWTLVAQLCRARESA